ncbi:MAG TPA: hypothetical protein VN802_01680 [Stellaceae bacterium]|nr:hypothetical protein [Stellaceae bacterium]
MRSISRKLAAAATALSLAATSGAMPAVAATVACFQTADMEADQAMRFQTELMVLSDTCGVTSYRDFTVRNREQIIAYQHQLLDHFKRIGARSPQASLDSFLTQIANESALKDGRELREVVCSRSATLFVTAQTLDSEHFRVRASELATTNQATYRRCK